MICTLYLAPVDVLTDLPALLTGHILAFSLGHIGALLAGHVNALLAGNLGKDYNSGGKIIMSK